MKSVIKRAASIDAVDKQTAVRLSGRLARDLGALGRRQLLKPGPYRLEATTPAQSTAAGSFSRSAGCSGGVKSTSPVAFRTSRCASWFKSRGRLLCGQARELA
jgi:hypothetical protein